MEGQDSSAANGTAPNPEGDSNPPPGKKKRKNKLKPRRRATLKRRRLAAERAAERAEREKGAPTFMRFSI